MATKNTYKVDETLEEEFNLKHLLLASKYIKRYLKKMISAILFSALGGATALLTPMITKRALDVAVPNKDVRELITLVVMMVCVFAVSVFFTTIRSRLMVNVSQNIIYDIRKDLFAHLQKLSFQYYDDRPHGKILIRVVNYVNSVSDMLSNGLINVILEIINLAIIVVFKSVISK